MQLQDGKLLFTLEEIHNEVVLYFVEFLCSSQTVLVLNFTGLIQKEVMESKNLNICRSPSEQEMKETLFAIPINSSSDPDGFNAGFFQHCWELIKNNLVEAIRDFFAGT